MTHAELIDIGARFLKNTRNHWLRSGFIVKDFVSMCYETPDIFGIRGSNNVLIEVKVSKQDFKRDHKKRFRQDPSTGIGLFRYYLCPENLISEQELPKGWGLLYCNNKNKIKIIKYSQPFKERNTHGELSITYSIIRRLAGKYGILEFKDNNVNIL